jgi:sulfate adenylyltransferase
VTLLSADDQDVLELMRLGAADTRVTAARLPLGVPLVDRENTPLARIDDGGETRVVHLIAPRAARFESAAAGTARRTTAEARAAWPSGTRAVPLFRVPTAPEWDALVTGLAAIATDRLVIVGFAASSTGDETVRALADSIPVLAEELSGRLDLTVDALVVPWPDASSAAIDPVEWRGMSSPQIAESIAERFGLTLAGDLPVLDPTPAAGAEMPEVLRGVLPTSRPQRRGLAVLLTGLSGSGKSTLAQALASELRRTRTVTLLDGDDVRRLLSAGLGFDRASRELNVERIGFVAATIAHHGGCAIAAPIAPFADGRRRFREQVEAEGEFFLVHVSTPLEVCEARDRKGLYAKARAGEIPEFTGISSPYEPPDDADLRIDTSVVDVPDAVALILAGLRQRGATVT